MLPKEMGAPFSFHPHYSTIGIAPLRILGPNPLPWLGRRFQPGKGKPKEPEVIAFPPPPEHSAPKAWVSFKEEHTLVPNPSFRVYGKEILPRVRHEATEWRAPNLFPKELTSFTTKCGEVRA